MVGGKFLYSRAAVELGRPAMTACSKFRSLRRDRGWRWGFGKAAVLVRQEEKELVLDEGAAESSAELVKAKGLARRSRLVGEEAVGVEDNRCGRNTSRCRDTGWSLTW